MKTPFLKLVADSLREKFANDLSNVTIICPNKRARLFLNEYLLESSTNGKSLWAPRYTTIGELFASLIDGTVADPIECVCKIFQHYKAQTNCDDNLDYFWGWGEKMLSDFNDIDKNLTDARQLFTNFVDLKEMDSLDYLDESMEKALKNFFQNFSVEDNTLIKERFLQMWQALLPIYEALNVETEDKVYPYEGALQRKVWEDIKAGNITFPEEQTYVFVGFNVLNKVEKQLFVHLKKIGQALFYWDYDAYYANPNTSSEVGVHALENLTLFKNELSEEHFRNLEEVESITTVASPTESGQVRYATAWIREQLKEVSERDIAIVICNENLLQPLLHAIPDEVKYVNITKGYPLIQTLPFHEIDQYIEQHNTKTEHQNCSVADLLRQVGEHITTKGYVSFDTAEEAKENTPNMDEILYNEAYFQIYTITNRLLTLAEEGLLNITRPTLQRLMRKIANSTTIPFHGEPVQGIQIMGVLETRNLDFDRVLMLSTNEGKMPQSTKAPSGIIPYNLREAFSLTTPRHRTAVYAYHFYRMLSRCSSATLVYNSSTDAGGEKSRFITQLEMESNIPIHEKHLVASTSPVKSERTPAQKPEDIASRFKRFSPSAINTYMRCEKSFYYQYVMGLREVETETEVIQPNTLGTLFHRVAQTLYLGTYDEAEIEQIKYPVEVTQGRIKHLMSKDGKITIDTHIRQAFEFEKIPYHPLAATVIKSYIKRLMEIDIKVAPFHLLGSEIKVSAPITVPTCEGDKTIELSGSIDRLDCITMDGAKQVRIIDYKTGGKEEKTLTKWEDVFHPGKSHKHYILQTLIYSYCYTHNHPDTAVAPGLIFIHNVKSNEDYQVVVNHNKQMMSDFNDIKTEFAKGLGGVLAEMLSKDRAFMPTQIERNCETCPFAQLCD